MPPRTTPLVISSYRAGLVVSTALHLELEIPVFHFPLEYPRMGMDKAYSGTGTGITAWESKEWESHSLRAVVA